MGLPRRRSPARVRLRLRRRRTRRTGSFGALPGRLVRDPRAPAGRRQHLPGREGRSRVRAERHVHDQGRPSTTRNTTSGIRVPRARRRPPCPRLPVGTTLATSPTLVSGFGRGLDLPAGTNTSWLIPDLDAFARTFDIYSNTGTFALGSINNDSARGNNRSVDGGRPRRLSTGRLHASTGAFPFAAISALRYARTEQTSQGYLPAGGAAGAADRGERVLRRAAVAQRRRRADAGPADSRFGAAKVMTRPALGQVTPGGIDQPRRQPGRRDRQSVSRIRRARRPYDLAVEWYFDEGALLSGAIFYKDIDTLRADARRADARSTSRAIRSTCSRARRSTAPKSFAFSVAGQHRGRPAQGLRDQLPAAASSSCRALEQFRRAAQLHVRRIRRSTT